MRAFTNHLQPYYFPSHSRNWRRSITGHFGSLVTTLIDQRNVSRALGILGIMIGAGPILGPSVGGLFLAINAWRFIFLVERSLCDIGNCLQSITHQPHS